MKNRFADRLTQLLREKGISKRELARNIEASAMSVSDWSNGKVQPTAENIYRTASYFEVSADYLLGLADEEDGYTYNTHNQNNVNINNCHGVMNNYGGVNTYSGDIHYNKPKR